MNYMLRGSERLQGDSSAPLTVFLCVYRWEWSAEKALTRREKILLCVRGRTHTCAPLRYGTAWCFHSLWESRRISSLAPEPSPSFSEVAAVVARGAPSSHHPSCLQVHSSKRVRKSTLNCDLVDFQVLKETAVPLQKTLLTKT